MLAPLQRHTLLVTKTLLQDVFMLIVVDDMNALVVSPQNSGNPVMSPPVRAADPQNPSHDAHLPMKPFWGRVSLLVAFRWSPTC